MSAETLRRAAALMRERAEAATPGAWEAGERIVWATSGRNPYVITDGEAGDGGAFSGENAEHIASWHPAVALAVADWLDSTAERIDAARDPKNGGRRNHSWRGSREALTVARAYLGESA